MNECAAGTHNCIEDAFCVNVIGSFSCLCSDQNGLFDCTGMYVSLSEQQQGSYYFVL